MTPLSTYHTVRYFPLGCPLHGAQFCACHGGALPPLQLVKPEPPIPLRARRPEHGPTGGSPVVGTWIMVTRAGSSRLGRVMDDTGAAALVQFDDGIHELVPLKWASWEAVEIEARSAG